MNGVDSVLHVHRSIGTMADKLGPENSFLKISLKDLFHY